LLPTEKLLASQEGLSVMELVNCEWRGN